MFDVLWVLFGVVFLGGGVFGRRYPLCVCARSLAHLVYRQERKNILTNVEECREGKLIWRVALF